MKKNLKRFLCILCSIVILNFSLSVNVIADNYKIGNYNGKFDYIIINKAVHITEIDKNISELTIPSKIEGYPVKYISDSACKYGNLTKLSLPNTLKEIGNEAFSGTQIDDISIPSSVTTLVSD